MSDPIRVQGASLDEMPHERIGVVSGLRLIPVERLTRVMLLVTYARDFGHRHKSIGEIVNYPRRHREVLACSPFAWKTHAFSKCVATRKTRGEISSVFKSICHRSRSIS